MEGALVAAQEAFDRHDWETTVESLTHEERLGPGEYELLAKASWWCGDPDGAIDAWESAYSGYVDAGNTDEAAYAALRLGELAFRQGSMSIASGWLAKAERVLEGQPESGVTAWLTFFHAAMAIFGPGDIDEAIRLSDKAIALARAYDNRDAESVALALKGAALVLNGSWKEGLALIDEATASAVSGEMDPKWASDVYCTTIGTCSNLGDYRRAAEWTDVADRWMEKHGVRGYRGECSVHRAELKRHRGSWPEAEEEARTACVELEQFRMMDVVGFANQEIGEVRLNMGDLEGAEDSFNKAFELGRDPQPGFARLLLVRGEVAEAAKSIAESLGGGAGNDLLRKGRMLPVQVEIALESDDHATAKAAVDELESISSTYPSPVLEAAALTARGRLQLHDGESEEAAETLDGAWRSWQRIDIPYEAARARELLGRAHAAAGSESRSSRELKAALSAYRELGAAFDIARLAPELTDGSVTPRVTKTFMFTDIVTSTDLVSTMGDKAWEKLLKWHDRTLRSAFKKHQGEEVRHTGDGFFVTFDRAFDAVACAVAIQRVLAEHRNDAGFAPSVRIGLHTAEATQRGADYAGMEVHAAARVGSLGDAEEIYVSAATREEAGSESYSYSEPEVVELKGIAEPMTVHRVEWA